MLFVLFYFLSLLQASNGVNMIGVTPQSIGMGGTGTALFTSAQNALFKNPSLLPHDERYEMEAYAHWVSPSSQGDYGSGFKQSNMPSKFVPDISVARGINKQWSVALGFLPYSGGSSNYPDEANIAKIKSELSVLELKLGVAYQTPLAGLKVGLAPMIGFGSYAFNESLSTGNSTQSTRAPSSATAFGLLAGVSYDWAPLTLGAAFTTKRTYAYKDVVDLKYFGSFPPSGDGIDPLTLEQPMEFTLGAAYALSNAWNMSVDYRLIGWGSAAGYQDFGWKDQHVIALGTQYVWSQFAFRAGFSWATSIYDNVTGEAGSTTTNVQGTPVFKQNVSAVELFALPAFTTTHLSLGIGYTVLSNLSVESSFFIAPEATITRAGTAAAAYSYTAKASQWGLSLGTRLTL